MDKNNNGLSGLVNLGNTCFINSCIQVISHTHELNNLLNLKTFQSKIKNNNEGMLLLEWDELRKLMWNENCVISPNKFIKKIQTVSEIKGIDIFTGYQQNDLPEFLIFLIDCFHNALSREVNMNISGKIVNKTDKMAKECFNMVKKMYSREYSEIWDLFYGIHISQIISIDNKTVLSNTPEPFFIIDLPIPSNNKNPTLMDCFELYLQGEILEDSNAWYNEKTKEKQNVIKKLSYWSLPHILVIDIKRFTINNKKLKILVDFPLNDLNLCKYVIGYKKNTYIYDLYAICNHTGNVYGGHYTSFVKNMNEKWYHFNDNNITEISDLNKLITSNAYCFFYRKRKS